MPTLPPFTFTQEVTAESAKQDHLHVTLGNWVITGNTEDIDALRDRMASPPDYLRNHGTVEFIMTNWGRLFSRPQEHGTSRFPLSVRREPLEICGQIIPPPIFSGKWTFGHYVREGTQSRPTITRLHLHLNPTRYVRYQSSVPLPPETVDGPWPPAKLFASRSNGSAGEIVLNNNDNWIPDSRRWAAFTTPMRWRRHLAAYFAAVTDVFESELERVTSMSNQASWNRAAESLNLRSAETYWEFLAENPTGLVSSIKRFFDTFTANERHTNSFQCNSSLDGNALSLQAEINPGRTIRIYAKTNRRLRIEVIHSFSGERCYSMEGGHTAALWSRLPQKLEWLAGDAAELVNRFLAHCRGRSAGVSTSIPAYQFLMEICQQSRRNFEIATTIAHLLINNETVSSEGCGEQMQRTLQRLSEAGVLEYSAQRKNYVVTAPRQAALAMLQEHGKRGFNFLMARVRTRATGG